MLRGILVAACALLLIGQVEDKPQPASRPTQTQPATRPTDSNPTLRKPAQVEILKNLLRQQDRPTPIQSQTSPGRPDSTPGLGSDGRPLLAEGTFLVERPGRLMREGGRAKFVFHVNGESEASRSMPVLESQLLESMEREAEAGFSEFIVSAEVTRYRGTNYLLLRKVLRRTEHGNLSP